MQRCRKCEPLPEEVRRTADLLERRWLLSVLYAAQSGALRFNEFKQMLGSVPPRTLAQRLSELEAAGLLDRTVIDARPPRAEYRLTKTGERFAELVTAFSRLGAKRLSAERTRGKGLGKPGGFPSASRSEP